MTSWQINDNRFDFSMTHTIAAPKELVYRVLADMEAYPEFINDLVSVRRVGNRYHFVAKAAILTVPATISVSETPARSIAFDLIEGPVERLSGSWLIEDQNEDRDTAARTRVTLTIHVESEARGQWLLRMTGKYVESKADRLIKAFSRRVAALQRGEIAAPVPKKGILVWFKALWRRLFGQPHRPKTTGSPATPSFRGEQQAKTLEALAATIIPPDDFDDGVQDLGFVSLVETRARYEAGRTQLYTTALAAIDQLAQTMFGQKSFTKLTPAERTALLAAVRQDEVNGPAWGQITPSSFFEALWEDVLFLYCTHPATWARIGFPGPSFDSGGYPEAGGPQNFMEKPHHV